MGEAVRLPPRVARCLICRHQVPEHSVEHGQGVRTPVFEGGQGDRGPEPVAPVSLGERAQGGDAVEAQQGLEAGVLLGRVQAQVGRSIHDAGVGDRRAEGHGVGEGRATKRCPSAV